MNRLGQTCGLESRKSVIVLYAEVGLDRLHCRAVEESITIGNIKIADQCCRIV